MNPRTARRTLLVSLVLLSGCATVFPPEPTLTIAAGSSVCTAPRNGECAHLEKIADSLNTEEMNRRIAEAQAFEVIRK